MPTKYCEEQHNIITGCNTLQLGTFEYYRELDPAFTIADYEEGFLRIDTELGDNFEVTFNQWNSIFGEAMHIDSSGNVKMGTPRNLPGSCKFNAKDGVFEFDVDRGALKFSSNIDFRLYYPNSYIFCLSLDDPPDLRDPSTIYHKYDSSYSITANKLQKFASFVSILLIQNIKLSHFNDLEKFLDVPASIFQGQIACNVGIFPVDYVDEKRILVSSTDQLKKSSLIDLYLSSLYRKDKSYKDDNEVRIIFSLVHQHLGHLSVKKDPILLPLKEILSFTE